MPFTLGPLISERRAFLRRKTSRTTSARPALSTRGVTRGGCPVPACGELSGTTSQVVSPARASLKLGQDCQSRNRALEQGSARRVWRRSSRARRSRNPRRRSRRKRAGAMPFRIAASPRCRTGCDALRRARRAERPTDRLDSTRQPETAAAACRVCCLAARPTLATPNDRAVPSRPRGKQRLRSRVYQTRRFAQIDPCVSTSGRVGLRHGGRFSLPPSLVSSLV
jgi:hypothetical protein